jgi:hypothetical protein
MITDTVLTIAVWSGFALHLIAGVAVYRKWTTAPVIPILNLLVSLGVLAWWAQRWYGYLFRGITWYATDQLAPACAFAACIVAGFALWGRYPNVAANWVILVIDGLVLLAAGLFFAFFRMNRLI